MIAWLWSTALAAPCPDVPLTAADVVAQARIVHRRLVEDNGAVLRAREAEGQLIDDLACTAEPLSPHGAAIVLQVRGFTAFFAGEPAVAQRYFASARSAVPDLALSPELAPHPGHPLARAWADTRWDGATQPLPTSMVGRWRVNGRESPVVPRGLPVVLQIVGLDGLVERSSITDQPPVVALTPSPSDVPLEPVVPLRRPKVKTAVGMSLIVVGGATAGLVALRSEDWCIEPDRNGDGFSDCPASVIGAYGAGFGLMGIGAGLAIWGLATEVGGPSVRLGRTVGSGPEVRFRFVVP